MRRPWESSAGHHARLAERAQAGDREAFVALYRALYPPVAAFVGRRVRAAADTEDAVAQTFHKLLEALPRLDARQGTVLGYTLAIARNAVTDLHRAREGSPSVDADAAAPEPVSAEVPADAALEARQERDALDLAVAALGPEERRLLEWRFGDGLRHAEIAALTGAREAAVKQRLSRLLRTLRETLRSGQGAGEEAR
jgi:RNA polymerase sigma-70 factor (ECF subfamily)